MIATLNPYLVWHDVHVNREIVDQLLAAAIVYLTLLVAARTAGRLVRSPSCSASSSRSRSSRTRGCSSSRSSSLVSPLAASRLDGAGVCVGACALALLPWAVRNDVSVGCFTLSTDTKALWKANNANTYSTLAAGKWIDDVPDLAGAPKTPEYAGDYYRANHGCSR